MKKWTIFYKQSRTQSEPSFVENSIIEKMKEEVEDKWKHVDERIANMGKKFSMLDEKSEIKNDGPSNVMKTRITAKP